jgi:hypothetical protein
VRQGCKGRHYKEDGNNPTEVAVKHGANYLWTDPYRGGCLLAWELSISAASTMSHAQTRTPLPNTSSRPITNLSYNTHGQDFLYPTALGLLELQYGK